MTHIYNNILQWSIRGMLSVFVIMSIGLFTSTDAQAQDPVWTINAPESDDTLRLYLPNFIEEL